MLVWRLILGVVFAATIAALAWFDFYAVRSGLFLAPLALLSVALGSGELVRLFEENAAVTGNKNIPVGERLSPSRYVVTTGALLTTLISFSPMWWKDYPSDCPIGRAGWVAIGLAVGMLMAVVVEMASYKQPGVATMRLAQAVLGIAYCGGLMGFAAQLRLLGGEPWGSDGRWGMLALLSLVVVVKANDTGAYFAGRKLGRHKMTPLLSPGKTWEGAIGGTLLSIAGAALCLGPLADAMGCVAEQTATSWWTGVAIYGVLVGTAGVFGDLAISLLKRDSNLKNSSTWMPGFGGVLDLLDSVLFAAPVAYVLWIAHLVGPR